MSEPIQTSDLPITLESPVGPIVARAGQYYRNTRYLMVAILILYGAWSIYDGFVKWPAENHHATTPVAEGGEGLEKGPHTPLDVKLNQILGIALPPLGIALLVWFLHQSRGRYQLDGTLLTVPGHPPVRLDEVVAIDKSRWDRKGIALIEYQLQDGKKGSLTLDDFVYERDPTDAIFKRIDDVVTAKVEAKKEQMRPIALPPSNRPLRKPPQAPGK